MNWAPGTLIVCIRDDWKNRYPGISYVPKVGEHCVVLRDGGRCSCGCSAVYIQIAENPGVSYNAEFFRKVEGGACEAERAEALKPVEVLS